MSDLVTIPPGKTDLHSLNPETRPEKAFRNNGPDDLALTRFKLRELAEGWPCYRDACEWKNFRSIFHDGAFVYTTWSGRVPIDEFIAISQAGMDSGAFIMHRVHGVTTDIMPNSDRAVTKMKATITQRFDLNGVLADVECDCRFLYFWSLDKVSGKWGANFVRHWYEKDKIIPVDPRKIPEIDDEALKKYPIGYRLLGYCQDITGIATDKVLLDLPIHRRDMDEKHDLLYVQIKQWLDGEDIQI